LSSDSPPIITIDGPSGTGKGTIAQLLSNRLGWHCLDSGALYRVLGLAASRLGLDLESGGELARLARRLGVSFEGGQVLLDGADVSDAIRSEAAGTAASRVAAHPAVRSALLEWQRHQARKPGLVADGRDMGTVVFPQAGLKIFLDASPEERATRRYKQLKGKGLNVNLPALITDIHERDERDRNRPAAPLRPADDALIVDSTKLSIDEVLDRVLEEVRRVFPDLAS
jgi:cytidylate kinase